MLLRSLPNVKRGLGTIRQDVNVSIKGGTRIEIKGVQDLRQLPLLVELEVKRQEELLKMRDELKKVTWPTREDVIKSTWVVMICIGIASLILVGFDLLWGKIFSFLLQG